jgi:transposase
MSRPEASLAIGRGLPGRLRACPVEPQVAGASVGNGRTFVGLDVHARSVTVHALDAVTGEVWQRKLCPDPGEVLRWVSGLPGSVKVGYEAGPTGYGLYRCLNDHGILCVVAAPSKLHRPHGD